MYVPSSIFSGFLCMMVAEIALFKGPLHINAAKKLLQCIKCCGNSFSLRYFYIFILSIRAWSSSLSLEIPGRSPKLPKYLLDQHSPYPRRIISSNYTLPPFSVCDPPFQDLSTRLLLLRCIHIIKYGLRPSVQVQAPVPTVLNREIFCSWICKAFFMNNNAFDNRLKVNILFKLFIIYKFHTTFYLRSISNNLTFNFLKIN